MSARLGPPQAAWVGAIQETLMSAVHTPMPSDLLVRRRQDHGAVCGHADPEASPGAAPEVADIFRAYGDAYRATHRLSGQQLRVMQAIETCRTSALGGHLAQCDRCGAQVVRYHSCTDSSQLLHVPYIP